MEQATLIQQGIDLLIYGIGTVFVFLTVLVAVTRLMSTLVQRAVPDTADVTAAETPNDQIDRVIQVAINLYRKQHH